MLKLIFIPHSRIFGDGKTSEVWKGIWHGVQEESQKRNLACESESPKDYHNEKEYPEITSIAVEKKPDIMILSGAIDVSDKIKDYEGICVFVNTKPNWKVPIPHNYVGMDDFLAGKKSGELLLNQDEITVLRHENVHAGHDARVKGIKSVFPGFIKIVFFNPEENKPLNLEYDKNIIALGIRGAERLFEEEIFPENLVIFDYKKGLREKFPDSKIFFIDQDPPEQGRKAVLAAINGRDKSIEPKIL